MTWSRRCRRGARGCSPTRSLQGPLSRAGAAEGKPTAFACLSSAAALAAASTLSPGMSHVNCDARRLALQGLNEFTVNQLVGLRDVIVHAGVLEE